MRDLPTPRAIFDRIAVDFAVSSCKFLLVITQNQRRPEKFLSVVPGNLHAADTCNRRFTSCDHADRSLQHKNIAFQMGRLNRGRYDCVLRAACSL